MAGMQHARRRSSPAPIAPAGLGSDRLLTFAQIRPCLRRAWDRVAPLLVRVNTRSQPARANRKAGHGPGVTARRVIRQTRDSPGASADRQPHRLAWSLGGSSLRRAPRSAREPVAIRAIAYASTTSTRDRRRTGSCRRRRGMLARQVHALDETDDLKPEIDVVACGAFQQSRPLGPAVAGRHGWANSAEPAATRPRGAGAARI